MEWGPSRGSVGGVCEKSWVVKTSIFNRGVVSLGSGKLGWQGNSDKTALAAFDLGSSNWNVKDGDRSGRIGLGVTR